MTTSAPRERRSGVRDVRLAPHHGFEVPPGGKGRRANDAAAEQEVPVERPVVLDGPAETGPEDQRFAGRDRIDPEVPGAAGAACSGGTTLPVMRPPAVMRNRPARDVFSGHHEREDSALVRLGVQPRMELVAPGNHARQQKTSVRARPRFAADPGAGAAVHRLQHQHDVRGGEPVGRDHPAGNVGRPCGQHRDVDAYRVLPVADRHAPRAGDVGIRGIRGLQEADVRVRLGAEALGSLRRDDVVVAGLQLGDAIFAGIVGDRRTRRSRARALVSENPIRIAATDARSSGSPSSSVMRPAIAAARASATSMRSSTRPGPTSSTSPLGAGSFCPYCSVTYRAFEAVIVNRPAGTPRNSYVPSSAVRLKRSGVRGASLRRRQNDARHADGTPRWPRRSHVLAPSRAGEVSPSRLVAGAPGRPQHDREDAAAAGIADARARCRF